MSLRVEEGLDVDISRFSLIQASIIVFSQLAKSAQKLFKVSSGNAPKNLLPRQIRNISRLNTGLRVSRSDLCLC